MNALGVFSSATAAATEQPTPRQPLAERPRVAFTDSEGETDAADSRLWVVGLEGANPQQIGGNEPYQFDPQWSPDGELLVFSRNGDIMLVRPDGGGLRVVADSRGFDYGPRWSHDGEWIAFRGLNGLFVVARDGTGLRQLTNSQDDAQPVWSPDGSRIAFSRSRGESIDFAPRQSDVYVIEVDTGAAQRLTTDGTSHGAAWSPDGSLLSLSQGGDLAVMRVDGGDRRVIASRAGRGEWSPDGSRLAFLDLDSKRPSIVGADGSNRRQVGHGVTGSGPVVWTPDGRSVVLSTVRSSSGGAAVPPEGDLFVVAVGDGATRQLTDLGSAVDPAVSPGPPFVRRVAGSDRVGSAIEVSQEAFPGPQSCHREDGCAAPESIVVARADAYADALTAAPLAAELTAPLLLTPTQELPRAVTAEVERLVGLGARRAVVVGGPRAVSPRVEQQLVELGLAVERIAGTDRFGTAAAIAAQLDATQVYVVEGVDPDPARGWPDAIAVSGLAARQRRPLLLSTTDTLPQLTADALEALDVAEVTIVGGVKAVSAAVEQAIVTFVPRVDRLAGNDRFDTSARIANAALAEGAATARVVMASGADWPDGLTASALVATSGVLLLTHPDELAASPPTQAWLADHPSIGNLILVGGPAAIDPSVADEARATVIHGLPGDGPYAQGILAVMVDQEADGQATMERLVSEGTIQSFEPVFTGTDGEPSQDPVLRRWYYATVEVDRERAVIEYLRGDPDIVVAERVPIYRTTK